MQQQNYENSTTERRQMRRTQGQWGTRTEAACRAARAAPNPPPFLHLFFSLFCEPLSQHLTCLINWRTSKLFFYKRSKNKSDYFYHKSQGKLSILVLHISFAFVKNMGLYFQVVLRLASVSVFSVLLMTASQPCLEHK